MLTLSPLRITLDLPGLDPKQSATVMGRRKTPAKMSHMQTLGTCFTGPYRAKVTAFIKQLEISLSYLHGPGIIAESLKVEEEAEVRGM